MTLTMTDKATLWIIELLTSQLKTSSESLDVKLSAHIMWSLVWLRLIQIFIWWVAVGGQILIFVSKTPKKIFLFSMNINFSNNYQLWMTLRKIKLEKVWTNSLNIKIRNVPFITISHLTLTPKISSSQQSQHFSMSGKQHSSLGCYPGHKNILIITMLQHYVYKI